MLRSSESSLVDALRFNVHDLEIAYALGLAQLTNGQALAASGNFAAVYHEGGERAPQALDNLRAIDRLLNPNSTIPFVGVVSVMPTTPRLSRDWLASRIDGGWLLSRPRNHWSPS